MSTDFQAPTISSETIDEAKGSFTIEPLDKGFGYTYGASLRRVLLGSLSGAAITSVRIEGVSHEFDSIEGVKEDVTDIILNLKDIVIRMDGEGDTVEAPIVATGPGEVTGGDLDLPAGVEVLNPDAPIATLEKKARLELYVTIGRGRGYQSAEDNKDEEAPIGVIPIDSIFSPVKRAAYHVEAARVGRRTDFDRLTLELETNGSIEPSAALRQASELLIKTLAIFSDPDRVEELTARPEVEEQAVGDEPAASGTPDDDILIDELDLSVRSFNCLKRAGIETIGELLAKSRSELGAIPNFGEKSIEEVTETLQNRGHRLRED